EGLSRSGTFRIMDFDVEQQFAGANFEALQEVAESKGQKVYFLKDFEAIKDQLLSDNSYATVQKSQQKDVPLIDWKYLLGIIILALSAEWFLRKYYGLI
ncbi:MAG: VWA domain-containing protein, partial [Salinimicrobium sediminis]|nr:VWA domain-containing protein [Salinimicrobium sediminis]